VGEDTGGESVGIGVRYWVIGGVGIVVINGR